LPSISFWQIGTIALQNKAMVPKKFAGLVSVTSED